MKRFVLNILKFLLAIIIVYPFCVWGWGKFVPVKLNKNIVAEKGSYSFSYKRFKEIKKYGEVDVVILGSSHAFVEIDPRNFEEKGFKTFNLGSSAQTPIQTEVLIKRYLDILNPKTVVFEVFPRMFTIDGIESSMDLVRNDSVGIDYLSMALESRNIKLINTTIFHYMNSGLAQVYGEKYKIDKQYISGGFVVEKIKTIERLRYESQRWTFLEYQFDALQRIVKFLESKNVKVLLVEAPYTSSLYSSYSNHEEFEKRMLEIGRYINYNGRVNLVDTLHFSDPDHLNINGVRLFNSVLLNDFVQFLK